MSLSGKWFGRFSRIGESVRFQFAISSRPSDRLFGQVFLDTPDSGWMSDPVAHISRVSHDRHAPGPPPFGLIEPHAALLRRPRAGQLLYKVISVENCIRSIEGDYLHFNRVDAYQDYQQRRRILCPAIATRKETGCQRLSETYSSIARSR